MLFISRRKSQNWGQNAIKHSFSSYINKENRESQRPKTLTLNPRTHFSLFNSQMAMYTVLRRATAAVVPLAARRALATSSSRTFHSALSVKLLLNKEINPFVPSRSFSNAVAKKPVADDNLVQVLQTEIECAIEEDAGKVNFFNY
jgi:complement component 1 Q subcomponent-binding protein